jgi:hypothetical protein
MDRQLQHLLQVRPNVPHRSAAAQEPDRRRLQLPSLGLRELQRAFDLPCQFLDGRVGRVGDRRLNRRIG